jgi:hypothetical protein
MGRSLSSILGIIAAILVIVAAVYYLTNEADDSELEVDIGMVQETPPPAPALPSADVTVIRFA